MKKTFCMILALLMCGLILATAGVAVWASPADTDPTEAPTVEQTADPAPATPTPAQEADPDPDPDAGGISGYEVATVPVLVIICFALGECVKPTNLDNKWIPALMIPTGAVLGFLAFHVMPDFPANDPITAIGVGVSSGLAATGLHQLYKQMKKGA